MANTKIEWATKVWNPVTGCSKVSPGCDHCYAERMATRLRGRCGYPEDEPFRVTLHPERLLEPLKWKKPQRVFLCSMGDWMHPDVPTEFIDNILEIILVCPGHKFITLTKRPENLEKKLYGITMDHPLRALGGGDYLPNLGLGVTVDNQEQADKRILLLLQTIAAVRFVSVEPMIGRVYINRELMNSLDWVICGGETGPGARPMHPDWVRSLRDQCQAANVPFFFKGWGEYLHKSQFPDSGVDLDYFNDKESRGFARVGKKASGRLLDGREWNEFPE